MRFLPAILVIVLMSCGSDEQELSQRVVIDQPVSPEEAIIQRCTDAMQGMPAEVQGDDTALIKTNCTVTQKRNERLCCDYNRLQFHTGNKQSDRELKRITDALLDGFFVYWKKTLADTGGMHEKWDAAYMVEPLYVSAQYASFRIDDSEYTGGAHANATAHYRNYALTAGKFQPVYFTNLLDTSIADFAYFDLQSRTVVFESERSRIDTNCHFCHYLKPMRFYLDGPMLPEEEYEDITFSFHSAGVKIRYTNVYPPMSPSTIQGVDCAHEPVCSNGLLIPAKELQKVLATRWKAAAWLK